MPSSCEAKEMGLWVFIIKSTPGGPHFLDAETEVQSSDANSAELGKAWPDFCFSISDSAEKNLVPDPETHPPSPPNPAWASPTASWVGHTGPGAISIAEITPLGAGW